MFDINIKRQPSDAKQTLGEMEVTQSGKVVFRCKTLELAWKNNQQQISCIPTGTYKVVKRWSEKYGNHFHVLNVPGRSFILIHQGNFYKEILGCILVGQSHTDINGDGYKDVANSKVTMQALNKVLADGKSFQLVIS
jgi:hypothetical protein